MDDTSQVISGVFIGICALGAACILLRIALERDRLLGRYNHIKSLMEYEEALRRKVEQQQKSTATKKSFASPPPGADEPVATVEPVSES